MQIDVVIVDSSMALAEVAAAADSARLVSLGPCHGAVDLLSLTRPGTPLAFAPRPDDVAALFFTSGSTGQPKGCAMTYGALSSHWSWKAPGHWSPTATELAAAFERYLLFGTLASLVVMEFLALCLLGGGTAIIPEPGIEAIFPQAIERYRITGSIITVPRLYRMLDLLRRNAVDVTSLRALMVSGSPITPDRLAAAIDRLGPVLYQGYGQTEAGSISMLTPSDIARLPAAALSSVGRPHPEISISVRDEQNQSIPPGTTGEIYVRGPYLMAGYWEQPDETRETLQQGWLRTRDLGYVDASGFLHLVGRARDVIMVNALVVYAGPIEQVLASHPDVDQAYVVGVLDDQTGEAVHAFVVPAVERRPSHDALCALVRSELGDDSVPKTITEVSAVPIAASGKPDKRALLDLPHAT
jgi:acyl-CoA synthetase (AMP-forming)/AMP-acid ligase II